MSVGEPYPADLPDLLRLACSQGMRLNVWFGARANGRGFQANLANSGNGWSVEYDADPLDAITKLLRQRYGAMLERKRATASPQPVDDDDLANLIG